jgi:hypothetical protein
MQPAKISVDAVATELDGVGQDIHVYLHKPTGEFVSLSTEELSAAEEGYDLEDYPDWQKEMIQTAAEVLESDEYVELPTSFDIHEYEIMDNFCWTLEPEIFREDMLNLIRGSGAFRRFKDAIYRHGIEDAWFAFRAQALRRIARRWLEDNAIPFTDDEDQAEASALADEDNTKPADVGEIILMNSMMQETYPILEMYQALRNQLVDILNDQDLTFRPGGENPTLGALCREIGETQQAYIDSFKSFTVDFSYSADEPGLETSVAQLKAWYSQLDAELKETVAGLPEETIQNKLIDRGGDFKLPLRIQLEVYREALLIFYGKVSVYLKAMGKPRPKQWQAWIA